MTAPGPQTATDFSGVDPRDTTEDPAYAAPGEELARSAAAETVGKLAPAALLETIDGQPIDLGEAYGRRPIYIKFWATWCVPCRQQMPAFERLYRELGDQVQFVALDIGLSDDLASVRKFRDTYGITMPIVMDDGRLAKLFALRVTPQHVLIGRDARVAYVGHADNQALADALQRVLHQPAAPPPSAPVAPVIAPAHRLGEVVEGLTITTTSGTTIPLAAAAPGRLRGVWFFSSWCEWYLETRRRGTAQACARARQAVEQLAAAPGGGVDWLGIAGGPWTTAQDLSDYQTTHHLTIPLALDASGDDFRAFGVRDIPSIILFDRDGRVVRIVAPSEPDLAKAVREALAGVQAHR
jgi:thiol-disulfide isomerase/thioredoxin